MSTFVKKSQLDYLLEVSFVRVQIADLLQFMTEQYVF